MTVTSLKHRIGYTFFLMAAFVSRILPRDAALALGAHLGGLGQLILRKRAAIAAENLRQAFPEKSPEEIKDTLRAVFRHLGISGMEILRVDLLKGKSDLNRYFSISGLEHLQEAFAMKRGVIILGGHIGFWEGGAFFLPALGFPVDCVAKRIRNPFIDRFFEKMRTTNGTHVLDSKKGARRILRALSQNRGIGILLDQHITRREAVPDTFFGRPVWTTPVITQIAMKQGVPIVPINVYRTKDYRYQVIIDPVILLERSDDPEAVIRNTSLLTANIENAVRRDITQWFWVHRRWRTPK
ncbi:MAG: lysophospholipid acyltransferase family protein [Desulfuromonadaceae bacterium]|nr:lysophospholipid acyltransferase family protein [Desulfuromonadaceae bacterium]